MALLDPRYNICMTIILKNLSDCFNFNKITIVMKKSD